IGVRPLINCRGTFTIISGSTTLPEVKRAMDEASRHYVNLDELMEAVSRRVAELTRAEWAIVTAGCAAAETLATCACIAGADPEKMQRLPNLDGLKDEVIIPRHSRNVYDQAVRMVEVRIVSPENMKELEGSFSPRTAMVYVLASPNDLGPFGLEPIAKAAHERGVPVFVDAAAEGLTPEVHLSRGADLVAYSGGKAIRGPQCAGLLLGRKDLCYAAWLNSAPHHAFGRSLKVGKEEIIGMLTAVEMWHKRDHAAEWKVWEARLAEIGRQVAKVPGVTTEVSQPTGLSNRAPQLRIKWDGGKLGISGKELFDELLAGEPRINLANSTGTRRERLSESSVSVMPWMMHPGDEKIVAARLYQVLSSPPKTPEPEKPSGSPAAVSGRWDARLEFRLGAANHVFFFEQQNEQLVGTHQGGFANGRLQGWIEGNEIEFRASHPIEGTRLGYNFRGRVQGESMEGMVDLGEYGEARWSARRYRYDGPTRGRSG
ncbi:MAG: aminotransferase class V-fold PLP-dependent enzyme, partial [Gammaproteobacteria bacterium]